MVFAEASGSGDFGSWEPYGPASDGNRAFQLYTGDPVPLPGAVWLLGSGLLGLIGLRQQLGR